MRTERSHADLNSPAVSQKVLQTLVAEASGEGVEGMRLVAETIMNRARERGITPEQVVMERGQYAPHSRALPAGSKVKMTDPGNLAAASKAWAAAQGPQDPTLGSEYFYSGSKQPTAREKLQVVLQHGNHRFMATESTIKEMQTNLKQMGLYQGEIDGDFGAATARAARIFSETQGINDPAQALESLGLEPAAGIEAVNAIFGPEAQTSPAAASIEAVFGQPDQLSGGLPPAAAQAAGSPDYRIGAGITPPVAAPPQMAGPAPGPASTMQPWSAQPPAPPQTRYDPLSAAIPSPAAPPGPAPGPASTMQPWSTPEAPEAPQASMADLEAAHAAREQLAGRGQQAALAAPPSMVDPRAEDAANTARQQMMDAAAGARAPLNQPQSDRVNLEGGLYQTAGAAGAEQPPMGTAEASGAIPLNPTDADQAHAVREQLAARGQEAALSAPPNMVDPRAEDAANTARQRTMDEAQATREGILEDRLGQYDQGDWREQRSQQALSDLPGPPEQEMAREIARANALGGLPQDMQGPVGLGGPDAPPFNAEAGAPQESGAASTGRIEATRYDPLSAAIPQGVSTTPEGNVHVDDNNSLADFLHMWDDAYTAPERQQLLDDIAARNAGATAPSMVAPAATAPQAPTIAPQSTTDTGPYTTGSLGSDQAPAQIIEQDHDLSMQGMKDSTRVQMQAAAQAAEQNGVHVLEITGGTEPGHKSHFAGTEIDFKGWQDVGKTQVWSPAQRVAVTKAATAFGATRVGLYSGDGRSIAHVGTGPGGGFSPFGAWGPGGRTSGVDVGQFAPEEREYAAALKGGVQSGMDYVGSTQDSIKDLQRTLNDQGHNLQVDGIMGNNTYKALAEHLTQIGPNISETVNSLHRQVQSGLSKDDDVRSWPSQPPAMADSGPATTGSIGGSYSQAPGQASSMTPWSSPSSSMNGPNIPGPSPLSPQDEATFEGYNPGSSYTPGAPPAPYASPAPAPAPASSFTVSAQPDDSRIGVTGPETTPSATLDLSPGYEHYNPLSSAPTAPAPINPATASYMSTASKDDEIAAPPNMVGSTTLTPTPVPTVGVVSNQTVVPTWQPAIGKLTPTQIQAPNLPVATVAPPPPAAVVAPPPATPPVVQTPPPAPPVVTKPFQEKVDTYAPKQDTSKIRNPIEKAAANATGADGKFDHDKFWDELGSKDLTQTQQVIAARTAAQGHFTQNKLPSLGLPNMPNLGLPDMGGMLSKPRAAITGIGGFFSNLFGGDQAAAGGIGSDFAAGMGGGNYNIQGQRDSPGSSGNWGGNYSGPGSGSYGGGGMGGSQYGSGFGGGGGYTGGGTYGGAGGQNIGQGTGGAYRNR